tara:strand:+ start:232 stop:723 length:492 start_codon:yes stop_codon:yes gene_type:complete
MNYRNKTTGQVSTQGEIRRANTNRSFPKVWDANVCTLLDIDPILASPHPSITNLQLVISNEPVRDARGNWVEKWVVADKFADTMEDDLVIITKEHKEAAYIASELAKEAATVRENRDKLIKQTDWTASTDLTMSEEMTAYRQALRDITNQEGFPNTIVWPTGV